MPTGQPAKRRDWLKLNTAWVVYGLVVGRDQSGGGLHGLRGTLGDIKISVITGSMLLFVAAQMFWLYRTGRLKP